MKLKWLIPLTFHIAICNSSAMAQEKCPLIPNKTALVKESVSHWEDFTVKNVVEAPSHDEVARLNDHWLELIQESRQILNQFSGYASIEGAKGNKESCYQEFHFTFTDKEHNPQTAVCFAGFQAFADGTVYFDLNGCERFTQNTDLAKLLKSVKRKIGP